MFILFAILLLSLAVGCYYAWQLFTMGAAYKAKLLCSNTFLADRDPGIVLRDDLNGLERFIRTKIDFTEKTVTAWLPGIPRQKAVYIENLGCVLPMDRQEFWRQPLNLPVPIVSRNQHSAEIWPADEHPVSKHSQSGLYAALEKRFSGSDSGIQTRAILIVHNGRLVAERYAAGITKDTPLLGWSMAKSIINALVGLLVKQGELSINQTVPIPEWSGTDPRAKITLDQMLRMSSGLKFDETDGAIISDVTKMLFRQPDAAAYAIAKSLQDAPDSHWHYSSGTTNIICRIIREKTGGSIAGAVQFMHRELFQPLDIKHAVIEPDASGNLVGSSFMYATAREWVRFGLLYLQDGVWNGKRLLPEGWVKYSSTPTHTAEKGQYGAHFWTNGGAAADPGKQPFPSLPADLYYAAGYKGQRLVIIPSRQLVVLRLGWSDDYNMEPLLTDVLSAL
jgi:CubicO group peptidase (beta-lactamase class C family)